MAETERPGDALDAQAEGDRNGRDGDLPESCASEPRRFLSSTMASGTISRLPSSTPTQFPVVARRGLKLGRPREHGERDGEPDGDQHPVAAVARDRTVLDLAGARHVDHAERPAETDRQSDEKVARQDRKQADREHPGTTMAPNCTGRGLPVPTNEYGADESRAGERVVRCRERLLEGAGGFIAGGHQAGAVAGVGELLAGASRSASMASRLAARRC